MQCGTVWQHGIFEFSTALLLGIYGNSALPPPFSVQPTVKSPANAGEVIGSSFGMNAPCHIHLSFSH